MSEPKSEKRKRGRPTKATPKLIEAILADIATGLTREQACACNGVSVSALREWEKRFPDLRAKTQGLRKAALLQRIENSSDWKAAAWLLERNFPEEFGKQKHPQIFAQQNNYQISQEKREIDVQVRRLRLREGSFGYGDESNQEGARP
jgi:transposase